MNLGFVTHQHMKYHRSRADVVAAILDAVKTVARQRPSMYKAYLSYAQLKEYLSVLVENGLLEYQKGELK
jgi:predicted transcriptional regulator